MPPHMAGRETEYREFDRLLKQDVILENMVLTGLRGVGKTVLMETFKPRALNAGWLWVGADLSESASVSEDNIALRLLTDLSIATSTVTVESSSKAHIGFGAQSTPTREPLSFQLLVDIYQGTPGLVSDRIKAVLEYVADVLQQHGRSRVIFAYDEAQNLTDHAAKEQYPLSVLLDVFQSIQKKDIRFMLLLTGLPTLFPKLVEARTFSERMFRVVTVGRLNDSDSREAVLKPIQVAACPVKFDDTSVRVICRESGGYPYFIQFICREVFDIFIQQTVRSGKPAAVPVEPIRRKLDTDFFSGRWAKVTDRQRQLLWVIASLAHPDDEFSIQEVVEKGKVLLVKAFSSSHVSQMLSSLGEHGLIYKNRFSKYSFAVPLLGQFILRTYRPDGISKC
jgi:AAA ATPase-like protein